MASKPAASFLVRHDFLLRRVHSLTGLIPVGAYMVVHLATNASIWNGAGTYQQAVNQIHSLGGLLPLVEWAFIFLPILFHGIYGIAIIRSGLPNNGSYPTSSNIRYTLQRATGLIAFLFIMWHVFHMHGWIHSETWREFIRPLGAQFAPFNAATSATAAMQQSPLIRIGYLVGILACVFHLANGIWTMGITWGLWITPEGQRRGNFVAGGVGAIILVIGVAAWAGFALKTKTDSDEFRDMRKVEDKILESRIESGLVDEIEAEHKRAPALKSKKRTGDANDSDANDSDANDSDANDSDANDSGANDPEPIAPEPSEAEPTDADDSPDRVEET
jgi:succinate dehydrogenase / fumarate reductase cytochrome b subunit